jgi:cellulose synthase/poly-beta-1,6-N-acetylglucosamine synthase-like glycosyltransferase
MKDWFDDIILVLNLAILPYFLYLLIIAMAAILKRRARPPQGEPRSRIVVMIPAHDEEDGIAATVASCRAADYPGSLFSVVVIADNCTDRTASVASGAGARVVERFDAARRSKGYALEYLIGRLVESGEFDALDALVVVDADTTIDADLLRRFDADLRAGRDWIQCYYTVANPDQSWRTRLITYAFSLINGVMLLGQTTLGSSAGLRGNGMCFSTRGLRRRPWASYGLVEDIEFSWMLRLDGERIAFEPSTCVRATMPGSGGSAAATQRRRWEFGRGEVRWRYLAPLIRTGRIGRWERLLAFCELTIPTMSGLLSAYLVLAALDYLAFAATPAGERTAIEWSLLACVAAMTVSVVVYAVSPFLAMQLPWRYAGSLAMFPVHVGWKALVRLGGRPKEWVRTARETRGDAAGCTGRRC